MKHSQRIFNLLEDIPKLTESQLNWVSSVVLQFKLPSVFWANSESDFVDQKVVDIIGDLLRIHHAMSRQALTKAPFEYAFEKALQLSGKRAELAPSGTNPGYDLIVEDERVSLKTEAAKTIKRQYIHVSKWMELGQGEWDPPNLQLSHFLDHLDGYDRILTLRCLEKKDNKYFYELVEIPKSLMLKAHRDFMSAAPKTTQISSPWYCLVNNEAGALQYKLYFDAGSERKLQVQKLDKNLCVIHASWDFITEPLKAAVEEAEEKQMCDES